MNVIYKQIVIESPDFVIHVYFEDRTSNRSGNVVELLNEAIYKGKPIGGSYSALEHKPKVPPNAQPHYHFYDRNRQLFAINKDGTAHDDSHGCKINNKIASFMKSVGYVVPSNNIIESTDLTNSRSGVFFTIQFIQNPDDIETERYQYIEPVEVLNG